MHMDDGADTDGGEANGLHSFKLYAPPLRADFIGRTSILNHVFGGEPSRVVLLQAPAGYGKSTTLRQIMSACDERAFLTAWLTFDEGDNDPRRFLIHFEALLASVSGQDAANGRFTRPRRLWLSLRLGDREASAVRQAGRVISRRFSSPGEHGDSELLP
jgi:hypothetical protein